MTAIGSIGASVIRAVWGDETSVGSLALFDFERRLSLPACDLVPKEALPMAAVCEICGKHPSWGMTVSHSHRRTKRRWNPNIQRVRALVDGSPKRVNVCTGCIKAGKVTKAGSPAA